MIITDHINLLPNPLIGPNNDSIGTRFPDMGEAYDKDLVNKAMQIAQENNIRIHKGVYLATSGPTFETPAEYKYFRIIGADAVGMSTTPEVIIARHMNLRCFAVSVITDLGVEGKLNIPPTNLSRMRQLKPKSRMTTIMTEMISTL